MQYYYFERCHLPIVMVPFSLTDTLSWLEPGSRTPEPPSFIQKSVGVGFPAAMHSSLAVSPRIRFVSEGFTRKMGGAERNRSEK